MARQKLRTEALRGHVLQSALTILSTHGVGEFTTRRVAHEASTSLPAVYELFGDKAGLVRDMFFASFQLLEARFNELVETDDPKADLLQAVRTFRSFASMNPELTEIMFSRPFVDFDPGPEQNRAGMNVQTFLVKRVARCIDMNDGSSNSSEIALVLIGLAQGLAAQERAGLLGPPEKARRRWSLAFEALLAGFGVR